MLNVVSPETADFRERQHRARFQSVTPTIVPTPGRAQHIVIRGSDLAGLSQVTIVGTDGALIDVPATVRRNSLHVDVPAAALQHPGFVRVSPSQWDADYVVMLAVGDDRLAKARVVGEPKLTVAFVDSDDDRGSVIRMMGDGLGEGMQVVLGRGRTPIMVLPTTVIDEQELVGDLIVSEVGAYDDFYVAVLSRDGRLSSRLPIAMPSRNAEPFEPGACSDEPPRPAVTRFRGEIAWDRPDQRIHLDGQLLRPGMAVRLSNRDQTVSTYAEPAVEPGDSPNLSSVSVRIPPEFVHRPAFSVVLVIDPRF